MHSLSAHKALQRNLQVRKHRPGNHQPSRMQVRIHRLHNLRLPERHTPVQRKFERSNSALNTRPARISLMHMQMRSSLLTCIVVCGFSRRNTQQLAHWHFPVPPRGRRLQ